MKSPHYRIIFNDLTDVNALINKMEIKKQVILYADFNVSYYFYKENIKLPKDILIYPDSTLLYLVLRIKGHNKPRYVSTDFQNKLLLESIKKGKRFFFFGDGQQTLEQLIINLNNSFNNINFCGIHQGYEINDEELIKKINSSNCDILFVGLGATRQETWIIKNYKKINCSLIISVGGWFKLLSCELKRSPWILRKVRLEWLYKLITEFPRLWKRYLLIGPIFIYHVLMSRNIKIMSDNDQE